MSAIFYPDGPFEQFYIPSILKEIYIDCVYNETFLGKKDMVVVDVGANIGLVTQYVRNFAKKVYAIEPEPNNFEALKKNKEYNKWDNVELFNIAIADYNGKGNLAINKKNKTMHTIIVDPDNKKSDGRYISYNAIEGSAVMIEGTDYDNKVETQFKRFDTFFDENKIDHVDFMKFDVEGAENMILKSEGFRLVAPKIDSMLVEFHYDNWMGLAKYVSDMGYEAKKYEVDATIVLFTRK